MNQNGHRESKKRRVKCNSDHRKMIDFSKFFNVQSYSSSSNHKSALCPCKSRLMLDFHLVVLQGHFFPGQDG